MSVADGGRALLFLSGTSELHMQRRWGVSGRRTQPADESLASKLVVERACWLKRLIADDIPPSCRTEVDVDDVFQEVCAGALRILSRSGPWGETSLNSQLRRIVHSKVVDAVKSQRRLKRGSKLRRIADNESSCRGSLDKLAAPGKTPSRDAFSAERAQAIRNLVTKMGRPYREVIELRYFEGLGLIEIAQLLGKSPSGINSLLHRAREELRSLLGDRTHYLDW